MSILQRNKKKATAIGIAAAAVAAIAIGGGTYAAFTSTATGPSGTLAAGTIQLDVTTTPSGAVPLFSATNIAPGYVSPSPMSVTVKNSGTLDGKLSAIIGVTPNTGGGLQKYLTVQGDCTYPTGHITIPATLVTNIPSAINAVPLGAGQTFSCNFTFAFPDNVTDQNDAQGDKVDFTSTFRLKQA
jgi:spore coat-associated protein N